MAITLTGTAVHMAVKYIAKKTEAFYNVPAELNE